MGLNELKLYLRVDNNEEDDTISTLQTAAEEYLNNAGISKDYSKELYKLAIKILVSHWFINRTAGNESTQQDAPFSLRAIIVQLCYS